ncbi:hypothetical protein LTR70_003955 [Exophiala xenobiotica]|uniref:BTB domain-containing protein n=1 Tax=Lithohypha guttulata TaxID=1690604 RepID=A0ABR0K9H6_9EURO|nr:hypothetical protein LTR24_005281 [Lithohypha guttulata]KAK5322108.1 hypothetical protein LTR70_003955 [Exophiala xenobiotica]
MPELSDAQKVTDATSTTDQTEITAAQFLRSLIVTIVVGKGSKAQSFPIYKDLLTTHSPYFKACLNGAWEEGKTNIVRLEDDNPKAFEIVANWLFKDPTAMKQTDITNKTVVVRYKLADKLLMTQLKNNILDGFQAFQLAKNESCSIGWLDHLCSKGLQRTALYDYCLKSYVSGLGAPEVKCAGDMFANAAGSLTNEEAMKDLITMMAKFMQQRWGDPRKETGCVYHDHSDGSSCSVVRGVKRRHE